MKTLRERFWNKVFLPHGTTDEDCWEWTGAKNERGYGSIHVNGSGDQKSSRISWILNRGEIPISHFVLHKCDRPSCVNPSHLFTGTHKENMRDKLNKGRDHNQIKTHCKFGHPFSGTNLRTYIKKVGKSTRVCKACQRKFQKEFAREKRLKQKTSKK